MLTQEIRRIYAEGRGEYGSPTICEVLRQQGYRVNHKRIARLMREVGLRSKVVRRFKRTTKPCKDQEAAPNLLQQRFQTEAPNRVWLSDITYIDTDEGWLYLTTIEDMWSSAAGRTCDHGSSASYGGRGSVADGLGATLRDAGAHRPFGSGQAIR